MASHQEYWKPHGLSSSLSRWETKCTQVEGRARANTDQQAAEGPATYPVSHFIADCEEHQHVVTLRDPHGIEVAEDVGTCYPALGREGKGKKGQLGMFSLSPQGSCQGVLGQRDGPWVAQLLPLTPGPPRTPSGTPITTSAFLCSTQHMSMLPHAEYEEVETCSGENTQQRGMGRTEGLEGSDRANLQTALLQELGPAANATRSLQNVDSTASRGSGI